MMELDTIWILFCPITTNNTVILALKPRGPVSIQIQADNFCPTSLSYYDTDTLLRGSTRLCP